MRKVVVAAMFAASMALAACNTVAGAGEDLEAAGQAVETTAEDAAQ